MARPFVTLIPAVLLVSACSATTTHAPAEVIEARPHPERGMEFDLRVENPLDEAAEAECSVNGPDGQGVTIVTDIPASGEETLTTRMQDLPEDTTLDEFDVSCTAQS